MHFGVVFAVCFLSYAAVGMCLFGYKVAGFATMGRSIHSTLEVSTARGRAVGTVRGTVFFWTLCAEKSEFAFRACYCLDQSGFER